MFKKHPELAVLKYTVIWIAMFCSTNVFALDGADFQTAFIEHLEYGPAKYLGVEGHGMDAKSVDQALLQVYHENGLQPFWVNTNGPGERATAIFEALKTANKHGLNPQDYHIDKIEKHWGSADVVGLVRLDIFLTLGLRGYVADMREGKIEPRKIDPKLFATARDVELDWNSLREQALSAPNMNDFFYEQVPPFAQYQKPQRVLMKHREIKERGGWEFIPEGKVLKPGMEDERLRLIRKRLTLTGDSKSDSAEGTTYDNELIQAVRDFQFRHDLETDGVVGKETLSAMNVPVHTRIRQIVINMERYRWLKHQIGERALFVNIAGFRVAGIKLGKGEIEIMMPVIVGKQYHKTPVFSDTIKYIEFNPFWNVPPSIARNEMLPKLKKNSYYLEERNIRVFSGWSADAKELDSTAIDWEKVSKRKMARYRLRQDPGPKNALGTVKFVFPNSYNVYLHDTPSHSLF